MAKIAWCTIAGMPAAVISGFACALIASQPAKPTCSGDLEMNRRWPHPVPEHWPQPYEPCRVYSDLSHEIWYIESKGASLPPAIPIFMASGYGQTDYRFGFPFRCLCRWENVQYRDSGILIAKSVGSEWAGKLPALGAVTLPLQPIWSGMIANTLAFGFVAFFGLQVLRRVRREFRLHQNQCLDCGYSFEGRALGSICPECGASDLVV